MNRITYTLLHWLGKSMTFSFFALLFPPANGLAPFDDETLPTFAVSTLAVAWTQSRRHWAEYLPWMSEKYLAVRWIISFQVLQSRRLLIVSQKQDPLLLDNVRSSDIIHYRRFAVSGVWLYSSSCTVARSARCFASLSVFDPSDVLSGVSTFHSGNIVYSYQMKDSFFLQISSK